jgi:hypothetical protein
LLLPDADADPLEPVALAQSLVECGTVGLIEPVAGIQRQQLNFRSVR